MKNISLTDIGKTMYLVPTGKNLKDEMKDSWEKQVVRAEIATFDGVAGSFKKLDSEYPNVEWYFSEVDSKIEKNYIITPFCAEHATPAYKTGYLYFHTKQDAEECAKQRQ